MKTRFVRACDVPRSPTHTHAYFYFPGLHRNLVFLTSVRAGAGGRGWSKPPEVRREIVERVGGTRKGEGRIGATKG